VPKINKNTEKILENRQKRIQESVLNVSNKKEEE